MAENVSLIFIVHRAQNSDIPEWKEKRTFYLSDFSGIAAKAVLAERRSLNSVRSSLFGGSKWAYR